VLNAATFVVSGLCESAEVIMTNWVIRRLYWRLNWMIQLVMHATDTEQSSDQATIINP
jgi:hypothetical protein